jgi:uncharacterized alkaline shock family protein YloU
LDPFDEIDAKEIDLPETVFIRDIENRVFQAITIKCLSEVTGVSLLEGNLIDNLLGREGIERVKGIYIEQDSKNHAVNIKVELNIAYGISIPDKAEEIQLKLVKNITELTGLHVASVHVVFKNLIGDPGIQLMQKEINEYAEEF